MNYHKIIFSIFIALTFSTIAVFNVHSGHQEVSDTDHSSMQLFSVFDLRERNSFVQVTNTGSSDITIHVQIHNVEQDCNENNFYDTLTPNDTHIYNLSDIQTNNGNPSGVVLPDGAYGRVSITNVEGIGLVSVDNTEENRVLMGNFRIIDVNGYEYRTNMAGYTGIFSCPEPGFVSDFWTFNFNQNNGVILSDLFVLTQNEAGPGEIEVPVDPVDDYELFDVDIFDLNEVPFSCRNVIIACINQDSPRLEELLENVSDNSDNAASVGSFEYGINDVLPSSKNAPLLCPGNTIQEGFVKLDSLNHSTEDTFGFIGLNNGNGRGSMDMIFSDNCATDMDSGD